MKILVIINPNSGKGNSEIIFNKYIKDYLNNNKINYELFISKNKGEITNFVTEYNFDNQKNILLLGGDGSLFEILQGVKDINDFNIYLTPVGSGNGIYTSLDKPQFKFCKINSDNNLKLSNFEINDKKGIFALGISIGIISDVDLNTEWLRFIGNTRYDLGGLYYILNTPSYNLKINYTDENNNNKTIDGEFLQLFIFKCSHCSDTMLLNSSQKMSDNNYTLIAIPNTVSKYELIKIFINLSAEYSPYYDNPKIIIDTIKSFEILPMDEKSINSLTIDGEYFEFNSPLKGSLTNKQIFIS